jgi:cysteine desulfurase
VLHAAQLAARGGCEVVQVAPAPSGRVDPEAFLDACTTDTVVASLMLASNETGVVQPVAEVAAALRERGIVFHTDAVQGVGKVRLGLRGLGVDLLSLSAHKLGGPKGIGALIIRRGVELTPLQGGPQEGGRRGGTHAVAQIAALGVAMTLVDERLSKMTAVRTRRERLESRLEERLPGCHIHGGQVERVPNTSLTGFDGVDAGALLMAADLAGLCVSRGAACASGAESPSHVLAAMQVPEPLALGTLRMSLGPETTDDEIDRAADIVATAIERQRVAVASRPA